MFDTVTEFEVIEHLDFEAGCEGDHHLPYHSGPAQWVAVFPCGCTRLACAGWGARLSLESKKWSVVLVGCIYCGRSGSGASLRLIPIPKGRQT